MSTEDLMAMYTRYGLTVLSEKRKIYHVENVYKCRLLDKNCGANAA